MNNIAATTKVASITLSTLTCVFRYSLLIILSVVPTLFASALAQETVPLELYWSQGRSDNYTTSEPAAGAQALREGYRFVRTPACLLAEERTGTVPLVTYYNRDLLEHITVASEQGRADANAAGYGRLRVEGFVYTDPQPGLVPLTLYYSDTRSDNFTSATDAGRRDAEGAGYRRVRVEGYALPPSACSSFTTPITDSEYVIILDKLTCTGECRVGDAVFSLFVSPTVASTRRGEIFEIEGEGDYAVNFGYRFSGIGVRWELSLIDARMTLNNVFTVENEGEVTLNGPQRSRSFITRLPGRRNDTVFDITYHVYRVDP
ncbi:MAG: hypothetical protein AAFR03_03530 [Pseudomonadota bacterium]